MPDEKIESTTVVTTPPATDTPAAPTTPVDDGPKEPSMGDALPKIEIETKDGEGNELSDEEKTSRYAKAAADASLENSVKIRVGNEVNNYLHDHPEYAEFASKIKTWVNHPNRFGLIKNGLPVENVIIEAIGVKNIMRIGAEIATKSQTKANETKDGGGKGGELPKVATDLKGMDFKSFSKVRDAVNNSFVKR